MTYPALADASSLKRELVEGLDIMILRELTGARLLRRAEDHHRSRQRDQKRAVDTQVYDTYEIERISRVAFELARKRHRNKVSVDGRKAQRHEVRRVVE